MPLFHYWTRAAFTTGPSADDPSISGPNFLGQVSANRTPEDTLLRTRLRGKFRCNVVSSAPPPTLSWPKFDVAFWAQYAPDSVPAADPWPDGILDLILGSMPSPVMSAHTQDRLNYTVLWETDDFLNSEARRKGAAAEGNFPGVNMAYQLFDPSGVTFPPVRFSQNLEFSGWLEALWGSTSAG